MTLSSPEWLNVFFYRVWPFVCLDLILLIIFVARKQSLAGSGAIRQGCPDYPILIVPKVVKWQSDLWKFWKPKDKPYGKLVLPEVKSIYCHWIHCTRVHYLSFRMTLEGRTFSYGRIFWGKFEIL